MHALAPKFCVLCLQQDEQEIGFPYYHREHQLPGVAVCWRHGTPLLKGCRNCGPLPIRSGGQLSMPGVCLCRQLRPLPLFEDIPGPESFHVWFAEQSSLLLTANARELHPPCARALAIKGGFYQRNEIRWDRLMDAFEARYGKGVLEWLGYPVWANALPRHWLQCLACDLRGKNMPTSVAAILFLGLFYDSIKEFTTAQIDEVPLSPSKPVMEPYAKRVARWNRRDKKLAYKVGKIGLGFKAADGRPARITLSYLLSRSRREFKFYREDPSRYPKTKAAFDRLSKEYPDRVIHWAVGELARLRRPVNATSLNYKSGLSLTVLREHKATIAEAIRKTGAVSRFTSEWNIAA